ARARAPPARRRAKSCRAHPLPVIERQRRGRPGLMRRAKATHHAPSSHWRIIASCTASRATTPLALDALIDDLLVALGIRKDDEIVAWPILEPAEQLDPLTPQVIDHATDIVRLKVHHHRRMTRRFRERRVLGSLQG